MPLPDAPNLDWLRKQAKRRLDDLRTANPAAKLTDAQFDLAKELGFSSWRALKTHVDSLTLDGQLFDAAKTGDASRLSALLDRPGTGFPAAAYATSPDTDRSVMEAIRARGGTRDLFTMLALGDWAAADRLLGENPAVVNPGGASFGVLHLMAKRNNLAAVKWLLDHKADPNALWNHWDARVSPLHMATMEHHTDVVRALLDAGADPLIRDSKFDADAIGWAEFFQRTDIVRMLRDSMGER